MGKGNRARTTRASDVISNQGTGRTVKSESKQKLITGVVTAAVVVLLAVCITLSAVYSTGFSLRVKAAAKTDNYKVSGTMMSYFFRTQYNYFLQQYGSYISYFGIDTGSSLKTQYADEENKQTWFDYFMESAKSEVKQILVFCENAKLEGIELTEENKKEIDTAMESLEKYALSYGYTTNGYVAAMYGTGVNASDVRKAMELSYLAENFRTVLNDRLKDAVTEDEINTYYDKNPASFLTADILTYTFTAALTMAGAEATAEEKATYESDKAAMKKLADELAACKTAEEFDAYIIAYLGGDVASDLFDGYYATAAKNLTDAEKPADDVLAAAKKAAVDYVIATIKGEKPTAPTAGTTNYEKAIDTARDDLLEEIQKQYDAVTVTGKAYADPAAEDTGDLEKWLFADGRAVNDTTVTVSEGESKSTYVASIVTEKAHRDENITKNVSHILLSKDTYTDAAGALLKAKEVLALYKAGEQTHDAFIALADEYNEDSSASYENVTSGTMVATFNDWLFDSSRKAGDVDIVETQYGAHVMYFDGDGDVAWHATAESGVVNEKFDTWFEEQTEKFPVSFNQNAINSIEG